MYISLISYLIVSADWLVFTNSPQTSSGPSEIHVTMRFSTLVVLPAISLASPYLKRATTTLIPTSVLDNTANLEQYFTYNYPWGGDTHNGMS